MIVYGEILFAENLIIGGVLLYITAQVHGIGFVERKNKLKLLAGSFLCGAFALIIFLPVRMFVAALLEITFAFTVCLLLFGRKKLWQKALTFLLVTYFMGGITMGLLLVTGNRALYTAAGVYTGDMKAGILALLIGVSLMTAKQIIRTVSKKKFYQEHVYHVRISSGKTVLEALAFLDTGNQLREPVSGKPVAVADERLWLRMQRRGLLREERFCMIPYESVGAGGLLEGVRVDCLYLGESCIKGAVIAKSDGVFQMGGESLADCELLLSKYMTEGKF